MLDRVIKNLGEQSINQFIKKIKTQEKADHVAISFLVNRKDRSFAIRCLSNCSDNREFVFILEYAKTKYINDMEYALAHELLHLFGADDLYNISNGTYYAPRDIMHYQSKYLSTMNLGPLTAYSVGLIYKQPATPFTVRSF